MRHIQLEAIAMLRFAAAATFTSRVLCLQTPPFEQALPGITMIRLMELIPQVHTADSTVPFIHMPRQDIALHARQAGLMIQDTHHLSHEHF